MVDFVVSTFTLTGHSDFCLLMPSAERLEAARDGDVAALLQGHGHQLLGEARMEEVEPHGGGVGEGQQEELGVPSHRIPQTWAARGQRVDVRRHHLVHVGRCCLVTVYETLCHWIGKKNTSDFVKISIFVSSLILTYKCLLFQCNLY